MLARLCVCDRQRERQIGSERERERGKEGGREEESTGRMEKREEKEC